MTHDPDDVSDEQHRASERRRIPSRVAAVRAKIDAAIAAAAVRGVPVRRSEYMVEHSSAGPIGCSPLGALVLDVPARHDHEEAMRLLDITPEELWAIEAGFQGWDQDDYDPHWYELGQRYALALGLECPEVQWPEDRDAERRAEACAERMRR